MCMDPKPQYDVQSCSTRPTTHLSRLTHYVTLDSITVNGDGILVERFALTCDEDFEIAVSH